MAARRHQALQPDATTRHVGTTIIEQDGHGRRPGARTIRLGTIDLPQRRDPEKGSGIETLVGIGLSDLTRGQVLGADARFFTRDGDVNQEDITNGAIGAWAAMPCYHFSLTDNPGVDHFSLPGDTVVLARLIANANAPRSTC